MRQPIRKMLPGVSLVLTFSVISGVSAAEIDDRILADLVADFKEHGLDFPPRTTMLVRRRMNGGVVNNVQQYDYELALVGSNEQGRKVYWFGREADSEPRRALDEVVAPDPRLAKSTDTASRSYRGAFVIHPDLAHAVQCRARGWDGLARALLNRRVQKPYGTRFGATAQRAPDLRQALAALAWNHWCNRFSRAKKGRREILGRLTKLSRGGAGKAPRPFATS
jgi:hypothetical protein